MFEFRIYIMYEFFDFVLYVLVFEFDSIKFVRRYYIFFFGRDFGVAGVFG